MFNDF